MISVLGFCSKDDSLGLESIAGNDEIMMFEWFEIRSNNGKERFLDLDL